MIRLEKLRKSYRQRLALEDLSLEIAEGEIFGLLGHNGAGKSTTFGCMLGHLEPDSGEAFIAGHSVQRDRAAALRRVGAIFETPSFYEYMSGWQNLRFFVSLSGLVPDQRLKEAVKLVGLTDRIHDPVRMYSHGMRQRLSLAQALLPEPTFILLDEPTEGLDPEGIHEMRAMIRNLRDERGLTVMLSSHLLSEVEQLCDRVAILHRGKQVFCGRWQNERNLWQLKLEGAGAENILKVLNVIPVEGDVFDLPVSLDVAELVRTLVHGGVAVRGIEPMKYSLEDFYLGKINQ